MHPGENALLFFAQVLGTAVVLAPALAFLATILAIFLSPMIAVAIFILSIGTILVIEALTLLDGKACGYMKDLGIGLAALGLTLFFTGILAAIVGVLSIIASAIASNETTCRP